MQISSTAHMSADPQTAWDAFHNEAILAHTIPGVESFTSRGGGAYDIVLTMGVAAIKGTYKGQVAFSEEREPESFVLSVQGAGGPGTIGADVAVTLRPASDGGTDLEWTAEAVLGGAIGGVGQRMLSGVAKRIATKFFNDIDQAIKNPPAVSPTDSAQAAGDSAAEVSAASGAEVATASGMGAAVAQGNGGAGQGALAPAALSAVTGGVRGGEFFAGAVVGAGAALLGVCVGLLAGRK